MTLKHESRNPHRGDQTPTMRSWVASLLVFFTSGAVLVIEILAARMLAPYVGVTLETYTAIIATVLAGISAGTYVGGRAADGYDARRLLGPLLVVGGALSIATVPLVRFVGPGAPATGVGVLMVTTITFLLPAAVLSAVSPVIVKMQLHDLGRTGEIVGRLSAIGTFGAIAGTLLAGFVLVEIATTSTSIYVIGAVTVLIGIVLAINLGRASIGAVGVPVIVAVLAAGMGVAAGEVCSAETTYHCAQIETDADRDSGRLLVLDTLRHSYVDLDDPSHLEFRYIRNFVAVIDGTTPVGPIDSVHIGGGGLSMARWLASERPGSTSTVLEIDGRLVDLVTERLGGIPDGTEVRVGDGRTLLDDVDDASVDVVFGDAFGGLAVPWHLTTVESVRDIERVLRDGGVYVVNVIDYPPLRFARSEAATIGEVFDHVAVIAPASTIEGREGGNVVLVGSNAPIDADAIEAGLTDGEEVLVDAEAETFVAGSEVLTDDHAPVDQWLARSRRPE